MKDIINVRKINNEETTPAVTYQGDQPCDDLSLATLIPHPNPTTQLLLSSKFILHRPEAGLNPLVDAAAYLFSLMGKLKQIKSYPSLEKLHAELVKEIMIYQERVEARNFQEDYIFEYIPITSYALCATLDDIIANTSWGGQGRWTNYSLVVAFNKESLSHKSFFIILERLIRDPDIYIDVMEFMYLCLSLGFKCQDPTSAPPLDHEQLNQITDSLYKRIRSFRGNFHKSLSPFPIKSTQIIKPTPWSNTSLWLVILLASSLLLLFFSGTKYLLDRSFNQAYQGLIGTEKMNMVN